MSALKEFARLITANMADLTEIYSQVLLDRWEESGETRIVPQQTLARQRLRAVKAACEAGNSVPLLQLFNGLPPGSEVPSRHAHLLELDYLGQTLLPIVPSLEAGQFLWQILAEARAMILTEADEAAARPIFTKALGLTPNHASVRAEQAAQNGTSAKPKTATRVSLPVDEAFAPKVTATTRLEQMQLGMLSRLADLPVYAFQVEANTVVREVEKLLRTHTILPGVIITENQTAIGVISRRKFFEQLGQLYGVAVYLNRPIRLILAAIGAPPLHLPATTPIADAIELALNRPQNFVYEPIIVELGEKSYRLLDIYTLLMAQSKLFAALQVNLQQANNELEARVEQRTRELTRVNSDLISARDEALAASRAKSEMLAKVSHELRTPLGVILGHTEMIQVGVYGPISAEQKNATARIIKSTNYLTDMVSQLLDQAKFEAGKMKLHNAQFAPADLVEDTIAKLGMLAQHKGLTLHSEVEPELPPLLYGDPIRVQQILVNLVSNAIKFTEQGRVWIRILSLPPDEWGIQVADTGPGIPVEAHSYIFEPFGQVDGSTTRTHAGTGLGLSIVKQLTDLMGGQLNLESHLDTGSTFTISLPLKSVRKEAGP